MARTNNLSNFLTDVADAIRTKKGSEELIAAEDFDTEIESIPSGGGKYAPKFISFYNYTGLDLQNLIDDETLDYSNITTAIYMLSLNGATGNDVNITTIDVSKIAHEATGITNMQNMFYERERLTTIIGINDLNTSSVTDMESMFFNCKRFDNLSLNGFDTSNVTNMQSMFNGCGSFPSQGGYLELNVNNFDVSKVKNFIYMFGGCKIQTLDLSNWVLNVAGNIDTSFMFNNCSSLAKLDIRGFDFTKIVTYTNMFGYTSSGVPNNCEIIVADNTAKTWLNTNFSRLTNVKTVAEYEAEQNA